MKKTILKICLGCLLIKVVLFCTTFGALCAENTTTSTQTLDQVLQNGNIYDLFSYVSRKYASFPDSWGGSPITGWSYDAYADWLETKGLSSQLQEDVTITDGGSGGRSYNIPQDLRQTMVQYVQETYIDQNQLSYTQCYIPSYKFLNTSASWNSYAQYKTLYDFMARQDGYVFFRWNPVGGGNNNLGKCHIVVIPRGVNFGLYGTTSNGQFTSVNPLTDWSSTSTPWNVNSNVKRYYLLQNATIIDGDNSIANLTPIYNSWQANGKWMMFTSNPNNEMVYVFNSINAYKAYNAGAPQAFYLPTGSTTTVPYNDVFNDSDLQSAGGYYNSIVDNSQTGWSADQVLALVDRILLSGGGSGTINEGTGNNDDSFSLGFLGKIGEVIGAVTGSITPVKDLVEDGIKTLLEDVFGWLPPEIVALWIAGITFAVFFGILRVIRG